MSMTWARVLITLTKKNGRHSRCLSRVQSLRLADGSDMATKGKRLKSGAMCRFLVEGHWVNGGVDSDGNSGVWENLNCMTGCLVGRGESTGHIIYWLCFKCLLVK